MNFQILFYTLCFIACFTQAEAQNVVLKLTLIKKGQKSLDNVWSLL